MPVKKTESKARERKRTKVSGKREKVRKRKQIGQIENEKASGKERNREQENTPSQRLNGRKAIVIKWACTHQ